MRTLTDEEKIEVAAQLTSALFAGLGEKAIPQNVAVGTKHHEAAVIRFFQTLDFIDSHQSARLRDPGSKE